MTSSQRALGRLAAAGALVALVVYGGAVTTAPQIPTWYAGLEKPVWTPPNWAFPVAWTLLYTLMAITLAKLWSLPPETPGRRAAMGLFLAQLALNAAWSPVFFALRAPWAGLGVITVLVVVLVLAVRAAFAVDKVAGWLLVPYLLWVCYASTLNAAVALLN